jgi:hypothetical protein
MIFSRQDASILGLPISKSVANNNIILLAGNRGRCKTLYGREKQIGRFRVDFCHNVLQGNGPEKAETVCDVGDNVGDSEKERFNRTRYSL